MRSFLFFSLFLILSTSLWSQKTGKAEKKAARKVERLNKLQQTDSYFTIEAIGTQRSVQDEATSQQVYDGFGGGIGLGSWRQRNNQIWEYRMIGAYNLIDSQAGTQTDDFLGDFSFAYLRQLPKEQFFLGGQATALAQVRYTAALGNSSLHWDLVGSLGVVGRYQDEQKIPFINRIWRIYAQAHVPVLAYVSRPVYGVTVDGRMDQYVSSLHRLQRIDTEFGVFIPLFSKKDNPNLLRFAYQWDILNWRDNERQRVLTAQHLLSIGLFVKVI